MSHLCQHYDEDPQKGCGGCAHQHIPGAPYAALKKQRVIDALAKNGVAGVVVDDTVVTPPKTRWRARLHGIKTQDGVQLGFQQVGSHTIVDMQQCHVLLPVLFDLLDPIREVLNTVTSIRDRFDVQLTVLGNQIDILLFVDRSFSVKQRQKLSDFAVEYKISRIAETVKGREPEVIALRGGVYKTVGGHQVTMPVGGFLQASAEGEAVLLSIVQKLILKARPKKIADLFCGIGTFSFPFAEEKFIKSIQGYDSFGPAINAYGEGIKNNNLGRLAAEKRDLFDLPLTRKELDGFDCVIIDPPRKGAVAQMRNLAKSSTPLIISVSCHPDTFARDSKILIDGGYTAQSITPVDQFIWSNHIEIVGVFTKPKSAAKKRRLG